MLRMLAASSGFALLTFVVVFIGSLISLLLGVGKFKDDDLYSILQLSFWCGVLVLVFSFLFSLAIGLIVGNI